MRVAWLNNREFHTQFRPKKLNDWREGRALILVKRTVKDMLVWGAQRILPPCDQIVECVKVWHKAEGNPRNGAPDNDSVPHVIPLLPRKSDRADAGGISVGRVASNSAAVCRNSASSSRESTPSASITP